MKRAMPLAQLNENKRKNPCKSVSQIEGSYTLDTMRIIPFVLLDNKSKSYKSVFKNLY